MWCRVGVVRYSGVEWVWSDTAMWSGWVRYSDVSGCAQAQTVMRYDTRSQWI